MKLSDVYDPEGQDGFSNRAAFETLPKPAQFFISSMQKQLTDRVERQCSKEFGIIGMGSLIKTSGFRSLDTNQRHRGAFNSLHLWGLAADFAKVGLFKDKFIKPCCGSIEVLNSGDCWHVQFKRGV